MKIFGSVNVLLFLCFPLLIHSQAPKKPSSSEIYHAIQKLSVLGSVLYVAAHPDDENTRMISYMENKLHMNTTYLSLTRGDGGQNLIGTDIRELLGVIRTQELLAARRIDGGNQLFSRANDFGYSKHPDETLEIWNKDEVLSDVVWAIRKTRPDIIINRFDHRTPGRTHGHHTSSAMLSVEAFDLVGSPDEYSEQLKYVEPWQPRRVFFNTSWWFYGSQENFEKADKSNMVAVDAGGFIPVLGKSNNEISALSRSQHKSQGFGSSGSRGMQMEYMELVGGDLPGDPQDPFAGINTTWTRIDGGDAVRDKLAEIEFNFDLTAPYRSVPALIDVYNMIKELPDDGHYIPMKLRELEEVIYWCSGLFLEASSDESYAVAGDTITMNFEMVNRSPVPITVDRISADFVRLDTAAMTLLPEEESRLLVMKANLPEHIQASNAYWLKTKGTLGMYDVQDQLMRGKPQGAPSGEVVFSVTIDSQKFQYKRPLVYKQTDPVRGEVYTDFSVRSTVTANIDQDVLLFENSNGKTVTVTLRANTAVQGELAFQVPQGWQINPTSLEVSMKKEEESTFPVTITPPSEAQEGFMNFKFSDNSGAEFIVQEQINIEYDHIPTQFILDEARIKIARLDLQTNGKNIGYIMGAGDEIPKYLQAVGYHVTLLQESDINAENLKQYDAVVAGIRAYNTIERIEYYRDPLLAYVENGGTYIVQYNTTRRLKAKDIGPYPLKVSRDRVTVEEAEMTILEPDHAAFLYPNKIGPADFEGWVQERGLYFPNEWDENYTALLSCNDPGEDAKSGGLLVTEYGKGHFVYTGISWFRQLPAGVPGAYRLFCNLLSLGKNTTP